MCWIVDVLEEMGVDGGLNLWWNFIGLDKDVVEIVWL